MDDPIQQVKNLAIDQVAQQIKTPYATAVMVQRPRELEIVRKRLKDEALIGGEDFYYGWGVGKNRIEGASINLAMSAVRAWGNCVILQEPIQDLPDAWVFTSSFVDLETGFTLQRQFRQSKRSSVSGAGDDNERKDDIRFQIGQSKASRNVALNAMPPSLIREAMETAKSGVRKTLTDWIAKQENKDGKTGMDQARDVVVSALVAMKISESRILSKMSRPTQAALDIDDLIVLRGDLMALKNGNEIASEIFPEPEKAQPETTTDAVMDHLKNGAGTPAPEPKVDKKEEAENQFDSFYPSTADIKWAIGKYPALDNAAIDAETSLWAHFHKTAGSKFKSLGQAWRKWIDMQYASQVEEAGQEQQASAEGAAQGAQQEPVEFPWGQGSPTDFINHCIDKGHGEAIEGEVEDLTARYNRVLSGEVPDALDNYTAPQGFDELEEKGVWIVESIKAYYQELALSKASE